MRMRQVPTKYKRTYIDSRLLLLFNRYGHSIFPIQFIPHKKKSIQAYMLLCRKALKKQTIRSNGTFKLQIQQ